MGSPAIFSGKFTKLLTQKGIMNSNGSLNQFDGATNYISYNNFENALTTGWARYKNTAGVAPVDGTGGTPTISFDATTSSPLRGSYSGLLGKGSGGSKQGEGISYDFTIDSSDQAQILTISFDYNTTTNYNDGDIRAYIYDVTNSQLIEVIDRDIYASTKGKYFGTFQTSSNSTSYRLIFHIANTGNIAWDFKVDNIVVGPQTIVKGAVVTDWQDYTPQWLAATTNPTLGNGTISGKWKRDGESLEVAITLLWGSTTSNGSGIWSFSLPNGYSIDSNKLTSGLYGLSNAGVQGNAILIDASASTARNIGAPYYIASTGRIGFQPNSNTSLGDNIPFTPSSGDSYSFNFKVPIQGWSSNIVLSEDVGNRTIVTNVSQSFTQSISDNTHTKVAFTSSITIDNDTTASWDTTNHRYNVPETGFYSINGSVGFASTAVERNLIVSIYVDGAVNKQAATRCLSSNTTLLEANHPCLYLTKGQYVELYAYQNDVASTTALNATSGKLCIAKRSSPQTIAASEVVAMRASTATGSLGTTSAVLKYIDVSYDTHNSYNTTTGEYTIPQTGYYEVNASVRSTTATYVATGYLLIDLKDELNATLNRSIVWGNGSSNSYGTNVATTIYLQKGKQIRVETTSTTSTTVNSQAYSNVLSITKVNGVN
jgi:hypothetical protein